MKPPILQAAWHNRVFCPPTAPGSGDESFVLAVVAPGAAGALWLDFRLAQAPSRAPEAAFGEVGLTWAPPHGGPPRVVRERLPAARVGVDPERAGVGMGECVLGEGHTSGRVADAAGAVTWDLTWTAQAPYLPLSEATPRPPKDAPVHGWLAAAGAHAAAHVAGRIEIWPRHGRHVEPEVVVVNGWQAVQVHRWRPRAAAGLPASWLWAVAAPSAEGQPGARLVAVALPHRGTFGTRQVVAARLWQGTRTWALDGARALGRSAESSAGPVAWSFTAQGPEASLACRVDLPATATPTERLTGAAGEVRERSVAHLGALEVDLHPRGGAPERLRLDQAVCEHLSLPSPGGHAPRA